MSRLVRSSRRSMIWHLLVLLTVAWPGPIPVAHSHDDFSFFHSGEIDVRLHLSRFHQDERDLDPSPLDRHVHWVFPSFDSSGVVCRNTETLSLVVLHDTSSTDVASEAAQPNGTELCFDAEMTKDLRSNRPEVSSFHIVGTLSHGRSLQAQFCTLRR